MLAKIQFPRGSIKSYIKVFCIKKGILYIVLLVFHYVFLLAYFRLSKQLFIGGSVCLCFATSEINVQLMQSLIRTLKKNSCS